VKEIILTQGKMALVDDEDFQYLTAFKWSAQKQRNTYYTGRMINLENGKRKTLMMHHVIMGTTPEGKEIDHIDGNGLNNQRSNLRFVTRRQNQQNAVNSKVKRTSKYPGVSYDSRRNKWKAYIKINNYHKDIGRFNAEIDAFNAYRNAVESIGDKVLMEVAA